MLLDLHVYTAGVSRQARCTCTGPFRVQRICAGVAAGRGDECAGQRVRAGGAGGPGGPHGRAHHPHHRPPPLHHHVCPPHCRSPLPATAAAHWSCLAYQFLCELILTSQDFSVIISIIMLLPMFMLQCAVPHGLMQHVFTVTHGTCSPVAMLVKVHIHHGCNDSLSAAS